MGGSRRDRFAAILGYRFKRPELLGEALTHPSVDAAPARPEGNYQRLEFLGDRVLGLVIADELLASFPGADAGELAPRLNALVCREALAGVAEDIDLGEHLDMARSERETGGEGKPGVLADACEAVIGALYLDGGLGAARDFIIGRWRGRIEALVRAPKDAKTRLQEWAQGLGRPTPDYRVVRREGPPHAPLFTVEAVVEGLAPLEAEGRSKRAAEHAAAAAMIEALRREGALGDD